MAPKATEYGAITSAAPVNWRIRNSAGSTNGLAERRQCQTNSAEQDDRGGEARADARRMPAPVVHLHDREGQRADAAGDQQRAPTGWAAARRGPGPPAASTSRSACATRPIGTLTRKIQRQLAVTSTPPTTGPSAAARPPIAVQVRTAPPRRSGGKDASSRPSEVGVISAAPAACTTRNATSVSTLLAAAQAAEAAVNSADAEQEAQVAAVALGQPAEEHQQRGIGDRVAVQDPRQVLERGVR